jgi:GPH family glycoside/pentoside/hexuronide:cation symporter
MYTDCVQYGEWTTGNNTAGLTISSSMFSLKFGSALGSAIPGFILAGFGFVANEVQSESAIDGIRFMFNLLPAMFFLSAGLLMFFYRIDTKMLAQIEQELKSKRIVPELPLS